VERKKRVWLGAALALAAFVACGIALSAHLLTRPSLDDDFFVGSWSTYDSAGGGFVELELLPDHPYEERYLLMVGPERVHVDRWSLVGRNLILLDLEEPSYGESESDSVSWTQRNVVLNIKRGLLDREGAALEQIERYRFTRAED
jgi:hypothetical protein